MTMLFNRFLCGDDSDSVFFNPDIFNLILMHFTAVQLLNFKAVSSHFKQTTTGHIFKRKELDLRYDTKHCDTRRKIFMLLPMFAKIEKLVLNDFQYYKFEDINYPSSSAITDTLLMLLQLPNVANHLKHIEFVHLRQFVNVNNARSGDQQRAVANNNSNTIDANDSGNGNGNGNGNGTDIVCNVNADDIGDVVEENSNGHSTNTSTDASISTDTSTDENAVWVIGNQKYYSHLQLDTYAIPPSQIPPRERKAQQPQPIRRTLVNANANANANANGNDSCEQNNCCCDCNRDRNCNDGNNNNSTKQNQLMASASDEGTYHCHCNDNGNGNGNGTKEEELLDEQMQSLQIVSVTNQSVAKDVGIVTQSDTHTDVDKDHNKDHDKDLNKSKSFVCTHFPNLQIFVTNVYIDSDVIITLTNTAPHLKVFDPERLLLFDADDVDMNAAMIEFAHKCKQLMFLNLIYGCFTPEFIKHLNLENLLGLIVHQNQHFLIDHSLLISQLLGKASNSRSCSDTVRHWMNDDHEFMSIAEINENFTKIKRKTDALNVFKLKALKFGDCDYILDPFDDAAELSAMEEIFIRKFADADIDFQFREQW